jgi:hypothetical protein
MSTKCIHRRDEWGNDHDRLEYDFSDIAVFIVKASLHPRGPVTKMILTKDRRVIWYTMEFRSALSFCEERRVEELSERTLKEFCDIVRAGDTVKGSLRISVDVYDADLMNRICSASKV